MSGSVIGSCGNEGRGVELLLLVVDGWGAGGAVQTQAY